MKCLTIAALLCAPAAVHFAHVAHGGACPLFHFAHDVVHDRTYDEHSDPSALRSIESAVPADVTAGESAAETPSFDLSTTGITWHEGLDSVRDQGRPILFFQLLGRFDDTHC